MIRKVLCIFVCLAALPLFAQPIDPTAVVRDQLEKTGAMARIRRDYNIPDNAQIKSFSAKGTLELVALEANPRTPLNLPESLTVVPVRNCTTDIEASQDVKASAERTATVDFRNTNTVTESESWSIRAQSVDLAKFKIPLNLKFEKDKTKSFSTSESNGQLYSERKLLETTTRVPSLKPGQSAGVYLSATKSTVEIPYSADLRVDGRATILFTPGGGGGRVCFYENINYSGDSFCVNASDAPTRESFAGFQPRSAWNDRISSIKLEGGAKVTVFENQNYDGAAYTLTRDMPDLRNPVPSGELTSRGVGLFVTGGLNDVISSYEIIPAKYPHACIWDDFDYKTYSICYPASDKGDPVNIAMNDAASSIQVFNGASAVLCQDFNGGGACSPAITSDQSRLGGNTNDAASSIKVSFPSAISFELSQYLDTPDKRMIKLSGVATGVDYSSVSATVDKIADTDAPCRK